MGDCRSDRIQTLIQKGVAIPAPESVEIGPEVDPGRISGDQVVLHSGTRMFGRDTLILPGVELGGESPVTVDNCFIGPKVALRGGYFRNAVFLEGVVFGSGGHVREGTILEEQSAAAHAVGLKQTILFPFVTLGSLINFCDCLMAGGTSRKNHSEVGSSYVHFNYTPNQDKATASLLGDVPRGVMLNQRPIFLGGQGGMVGPCRLEFGTVVAAGSIVRKDELRPDRLILEVPAKTVNLPFTRNRKAGRDRVVRNNVTYIANLMALMQWYRQARSRFVSPRFPDVLLAGLYHVLQLGIDERIRRLREYTENDGPGTSGGLGGERPEIGTEFEERLHFLEQVEGECFFRDRFLRGLQDAISDRGTDYVDVIRSLSPELSAYGTEWLRLVVDQVSAGLSEAFRIPAPHHASSRPFDPS